MIEGGDRVETGKDLVDWWRGVKPGREQLYSRLVPVDTVKELSFSSRSDTRATHPIQSDPQRSLLWKEVLRYLTRN